MRLMEILEKRFPENELKEAKGSFDMIGDVAIVEIPDSLSHREKDVVDALLEVHPNIRSLSIWACECAVDGRWGIFQLQNEFWHRRTPGPLPMGHSLEHWRLKRRRGPRVSRLDNSNFQARPDRKNL